MFNHNTGFAGAYDSTKGELAARRGFNYPGSDCAGKSRRIFHPIRSRSLASHVLGGTCESPDYPRLAATSYSLSHVRPPS